MKLALYCDVSSLSSIYIKDLLRQEFEKSGHSLDIFINPIQTTMAFTSQHLQGSCFKNIKLIFGAPYPANYDGVILTNQENKDSSLRNNVCQSFQKAKKLAIAIKDTSCLDFWPLNNNVKYGIPGIQHKIYRTYHWLDDTKANVFSIPVLSNFSYIKPNYLNMNDFYHKYNLKDHLKVVGFFPDGSHGSKVIPASHWQHKNLGELDKILNTIGCQIVCKLHPFEYYNRKMGNTEGKRSNLFYFPNIPTIQEEDTYELLKYSAASMSSLSTSGYEHYLYNLPHLSVSCSAGSKAREVQFIGEVMKQHNIICWRELIYGHVYSYDVFLNNIVGCFLDFFDAKHEQNFKYKENNPLFGNSYGALLSQIANVILGQF